MNYETYQKANEIAKAVKTAELVLEFFSERQTLVIQDIFDQSNNVIVSGRLFEDFKSFLKSEVETMSKEFNEL